MAENVADVLVLNVGHLSNRDAPRSIMILLVQSHANNVDK